eukprot:10556522-Lingulodinium_polyedra.AAC.1
MGKHKECSRSLPMGRVAAITHARAHINALHCIALHALRAFVCKQMLHCCGNLIDIEHAVSTVPLPSLDILQT